MKLHGHDETEIAHKLNKKYGLLSRVMKAGQADFFYAG